MMILSIVSGKGGVGKTMIAVAIANELARNNKTVIIDFDLFNRGLTGLFTSLITADVPFSEISLPSFLDNDVNDNCSIYSLKRNLYTVSYGDIGRGMLEHLETMDMDRLVTDVGDFLESIRSKTDCNVVILDCHGGPDNLSFASCMLADHTIIVSEPDKITLYGTLNFLRRLRSAVEGSQYSVYLVFNKVISAFSSQFLFRFYDQYLRTEFNDRELLAIYPLESHLTKAFEKTPFLTTVYPTSQLAEKTRLLLYNLLHTEKETILEKRTQNMPKWMRWVHKYYMGRWPKILELDFIFRVIAGLAVLLIISGSISIPIGQVIVMSALASSVGWLFVALFLNWTRGLDIFVTYSFRSRAFWRAGLGGFLLILLWSPLALYIGVFAGPKSGLPVAPVLPLILVCGWLLVRYLCRGFREITSEHRYPEGLFRIACVVGFVGIAALLAISRTS